jgi:small-conductance mechanosensitive channel
LDELIAQVQELSEFIGPNVWLQAVIIAAAFILAGKIADWVISRIIGQFAKRSDNEFDDRLVKLVHHPVFMSFVLAGLVLATQHLDMPAAATFITVNLLKTIAIVIWFRALGQLNNLIVETLRKSRGALAKSGMLPLVHNVMKVVLVALAIYFFFIAWRIDVTAWLASAGIVGLALSFAARDTLSNLFAGVSIIMDAPYKSGDYIILDSGERGVVTEIGLRSTRILTRDDIEITVPNSVMGNSTIRRLWQRRRPRARDARERRRRERTHPRNPVTARTLPEFRRLESRLRTHGMDCRSGHPRAGETPAQLRRLQEVQCRRHRDSVPAARPPRSHDAGRRVLTARRLVFVLGHDHAGQVSLKLFFLRILWRRRFAELRMIFGFLALALLLFGEAARLVLGFLHAPQCAALLF